MKKITNFFVGLCVLTTLSAFAHDSVAHISSSTGSFADFCQKFEKEYFGDAEWGKRYNLYRTKVQEINSHNEKYQRGEVSWTKGLNRFSDMTRSERARVRGYIDFTGRKPLAKRLNGPDQGVCATLGTTYEKAWDWRDHNAVTSVKDQGQCGSCWTFSSTGAMEGAYALQTGKLVPISEQQIVDCCKTEYGCNGGWMDDAFGYAQQNGICQEKGYPYEGVDQACDSSKCVKNTMVAGVVDVQANNQTALTLFAAKQPVAVAMDAEAWMDYSGGVFDDADCGTQLDHAILVVGWGHDESLNKDYWLVKNSWNTNWGEHGYIRMFRNSTDTSGPGMCGIALKASVPCVIDSE